MTSCIISCIRLNLEKLQVADSFIEEAGLNEGEEGACDEDIEVPFLLFFGSFWRILSFFVVLFCHLLCVCRYLILFSFPWSLDLINFYSMLF